MNIYEDLKNTKVDANINNKLIKIDEQNNMSIYVAEIASGARLPAHFHQKGHETYCILKGSGTMEVGKSIIEANEGDIIIVKEKEVHAISNQTEKPLCILFHTPSTHMNHDRYFIDEEGK